MNPEKNNLNVELTGLVDTAAAASSARSRLTTTSTEDPLVGELVDKILEAVGGKPGSAEYRMVRDLLITGSKLIPDGRHTGELKLITAAVKEMRYAYRVFARYADPHKITIFGSARTPEHHPDYKAAVEFSKLMSQAGWMAITGATRAAPVFAPTWCTSTRLRPNPRDSTSPPWARNSSMMGWFKLLKSATPVLSPAGKPALTNSSPRRATNLSRRLRTRRPRLER